MQSLFLTKAVITVRAQETMQPPNKRRRSNNNQTSAASPKEKALVDGMLSLNLAAKSTETIA